MVWSAVFSPAQELEVVVSVCLPSLGPVLFDEAGHRSVLAQVRV